MKQNVLLAALVLLGPAALLGATAPYEVVLLDWPGWTLIQLDMDSGDQTITPIDVLAGRPGADVLAAGTDRNVFLLNTSGVRPSSDLVESNVENNEWRVTEIPAVRPHDMDFTSDGNLVIASDFGVLATEPATGESTVIPRFGSYIEPDAVEMDSTGRVLTTARSGDMQVIWRSTPGPDFGE
jgi:hypothetical protein